ncbi:CBO0543 family protein [Desertibacillus haloalkaliphilus]|uniref:CBO0543 family protein n=1 Tax=Desertibacillus haloalkaliphilus TaxID=1328930 RepID=UPI001C255C30|nr:CBO0543 family protein [Desertibacillus haloalkaliphilus]MBU8907534.1 hypothetical protein [Desertibacillus haloalkaliphilus]
MNLGWNIESLITVSSIIASLIGIVWIMKHDWKRYGLLFLCSVLVGNLLCFLFILFGFYSYPYRLFPGLSEMPILAISTAFPFLVLIGVRYCPKAWPWKIPFYWVIVHLGLAAESYAIEQTNLIRYEYQWNFWDSYTWWWIYLLLFEWIGGLLIPPHNRKPIPIKTLRYGRLGWALVHFILIVTIFMFGYLLGRYAP